MKYKAALLYGSVRTERKGIRAVHCMEKVLTDGNFEVKVIDPAEYILPMLDYMYKEYDEGEAPAAMKQIAEILSASDTIVVVSGEYNHGIPPALKNLLDHFQREYYFKPSGIVSYSAGSFGGVRAAVQLRSVLGELGMPSVSTMVSIPKIQQTINARGELQNNLLDNKLEQFVNELQFYTEALATQREKGLPF